MPCPKCKKDSPLLSKFCMHCGLDFKAESARSKNRSDEKSVFATHRAESMAKLSDILGKQLKNTYIAGGAGLFLAIVGGFLFQIGGIVGGIVIGYVSYHLATRFTSNEYYSIPHSKDASGNHRCIYCGNKGVYVQGEYRTNNKHSSCSKCKEHLFSN